MFVMIHDIPTKKMSKNIPSLTNKKKFLIDERWKWLEWLEERDRANWETNRYFEFHKELVISGGFRLGGIESSTQCLLSLADNRTENIVRQKIR